MSHPFGQDIPIGNIDAELRKLWLDDDANTRASLTNFAIYSERDDALAENSALIEDITAEQACRAILIQADPNCKEAGARAWVTAHCRIDPRGQKNICSEQISFDLCGPTGDLLRNIVFAHLDSDLPLVFWWQGDLNENFDERLYSRIDRLLVNSDKWDQPRQSFAALRQALEDTGGRIAIHDLSWSRSYHFRLAIAKLFDDHLALGQLANLKKITITHEDGVPLAARMLGAWIADRVAGLAVEFEYLQDGQGANLTRINFDTGKSKFSIEREGNSRFLKTRIDCPEKSHETLSPAGPEHRSDLITDLMARAGSNSRYRQILNSPNFAW
ncbi:MAG: glucose-6-phosphate dehydrogenase assembly protein OpcA [Verrucomicrobiales bacterium]|jgi:glucose-6-phosphate dehydrogenase assembly protein OpcA